MTNNIKKDNNVISFNEYCLNNDVIPITQDKIILKKDFKKEKLQINVKSNVVSVFNLMDNCESYPEFYHNGQKQLIKSLRQGKLRVVATLDLHNYRQSEAIRLLESFLDNALTSGNTCIKIIHGKGHHSPDNKSVLKNLVRRFLETYPRLLAYTLAAANNGGDGVTLVKLKNKL